MEVENNLWDRLKWVKGGKLLLQKAEFLKVCMLTTSFPRFSGDTAGIFIYRLSSSLLERGIEIQVLSPQDNSCKHSEQWGNMAIRRFPYFYPSALQKLCYGAGILSNIKKSPILVFQVPGLLLAEGIFASLVLRKKKADVLHAHWSVPQGMVGALCKRLLGMKLVVSVHGSDVFWLNHTLLGKINRWIIDYADACTVNSKATQDLVRKISNRDDIEIIPMGVDVDLFENVKRNKRRTKRLPRERKTVLFVGRLIEVKGVEYLIRAVPKILAIHPDLELLIIGSGPEKSRLVKLAEILNVQDSVVFKKEIPQEELPDYYCVADVVVLPSIHTRKGETEGLGVVLLEAMACGVPVVGSNVGGIPDIIKHGETGLLAAEKDPEDLADKILKLVDDKRLRKRVIENGLKLVRENFSWDVIAEKFLQVYREVMQNGKRSLPSKQIRGISGGGA
ncbi:MAG: glycosyltransferase family 4 protein [Deltaproteobacteria bacterium]|nr:glycosyltransferase family 4 protein [Deltaproteobacteria bacterium]